MIDLLQLSRSFFRTKAEFDSWLYPEAKCKRCGLVKLIKYSRTRKYNGMCLQCVKTMKTQVFDKWAKKKRRNLSISGNKNMKTIYVYMNEGYLLYAEDQEKFTNDKLVCKLHIQDETDRRVMLDIMQETVECVLQKLNEDADLMGRTTKPNTGIN